MYCAHCGNENVDGNFCVHCGRPLVKVEKTEAHPLVLEVPPQPHSYEQKRRFTMEEYMATVDIRGKDEAEMYLTKLKYLFWIVMGSSVFVRVLTASASSEAVAFFELIHIGLLVYFTHFCYTVLKKENLPGSEALWCIFFAPFSWFHLYPTITNPLKIIMGEKELPFIVSDSEKTRMKDEAKKTSRRNLYALLAFVAFLVILILIALNN